MPRNNAFQFCRVVLAFVALLMAGTTLARAGTFTAFGPQNYTRQNGAPVTVTNTFSVQNLNTPYTLKVFNGGLHDDTTELVSSGFVMVNGVQVVGPSNFNQNVTEISVPVTLQRSNTISVQVRGKPGGLLTVEIVGTDNDPPLIHATVSPAPNSAGWNNTPVTVTFACSDATSGIANCPPPQVITSEGANQIVSGTATDVAGNSATTSVKVNLDKTGPQLNITSPASGSTINLSTTTISVTGSGSDQLSGLADITCNGTSAVISGQGFVCKLSLVQGANSIPVRATDVAGNSTTSTLNLTYAPAPQLAITTPANLSVTNLTPVTVNGTINDPAATLTINGINAPQSGGSFSIPVPLVEGLNVLTAVAKNAAGIASTATVQITLDTTPPHITVDAPADGSVTTDANVTVTGLANDVVVGTVNAQDVQVTVNGVPAQVANRTYAAVAVPLTVGKNTIQAVARDRAGNGTTTSVTVTRVLPTQPPAPAIGAAVIIQSITVVSGNNQTGTIATKLPVPLVIALTDPANHPLANQTVVFKVTGNNGGVAPDAFTASSPALAVSTDANGHAQVLWTLGQRAGAGINSVQASSALAVSPVNFTATGVTANAATIVVDSGNAQVGVLGQPLPFPFVTAVVDSGHNRVPNVPVVFTVKGGGGNLGGASSQTVTTDSNGRAIVVLNLGTEAGNGNNVVEATFPGNPGISASFVASARSPANPANTTISGVVLDNSNNPVVGATMLLFQTNQGSNNNLPLQIGTPVTTDAKGTFLIQPAPVGFFKLMADGTTAIGPQSYPTLEYDIVTIAGNANTVGMPIYLPALDTVHKLCVDEAHGGTLTLPQVPGFSLTVLPGSATFPGGSRQGCVTVTPVNGDKVPMEPGFGQQPRFIVTIQPVGTKFDPPAPITLPNVDGLAPNAVTEMYSYDHDLSMFVAIGTGTVSADGSAIVSSPGVGVLKAGWHCGGNPNQSGGATPVSVSITSTQSPQVEVGKTVTITASGSPSPGTYSWSSSDTTIATIQSSTDGTAVVLGVGVGTATITVTFTCQSGATATATVDVKVSTADIVVIGWVNSSAITLPGGASFLLRIDINTPLICSALLLDWVVGLPTDLFGQAEVDYANAFLLIHSGNAQPPSTINPDAQLAAGDFRLFNRLQATYSASGGTISNFSAIHSSAQVGTTPDPCGLVGNASGQAHPSNGSNGVTSSGTGVYQLAEGRLGTLGQRVNQTINGITTPWIWSVIRFDASGNPDTSDHAIFPTYYVYQDGSLITTYPQSAPTAFIPLGDTYQRLPSQIP